MKWLSDLRQYFRSDDPGAQARNTIALAVLSNIPFYPLYVAWIVGSRAWPTLLSFLSWPLFLLVPLLNRRSARAGQWGLVGAGLVDTGLCAYGLGAGTGVEAFYIAILLLPAVLYREALPMQRILMALATAAVLVAVRKMGGGLVAYTPSELHSLTLLHIISAGTLGLLILILWWRIHNASSST